MSAKSKTVKKISNAILSLLQEKAQHSPCTYKISGIAFDAKGDILGHMTNKHSQWNVLDYGEGRAGTAKHVEKNLIARYGSNIKTIVICRTGRSGNVLPIDPCPACQKLAAKLGITIISVMPGTGHAHE